MWLLDANMDVHLASVLTGLGINCETAGNRGWKALSNGDLVNSPGIISSANLLPARSNHFRISLSSW